MAPSRRTRTENANRPLSAADIGQGVSALVQLDADRQARRESVATVHLNHSDDEVDSPSPVFHSFVREDSANVAKLTNFAPGEFERLWVYVEGHLRENWNVGRGRKCTHRPKDVLFMCLASLKHCGRWDMVESVFKIKSATFQKMVLSFAEVISPFLYDKFVASAASKFTMEALVLGGNTFRNYPCARYATDVTFQHTNMPSGKLKERSGYYSAKHHLHGYKVEVSVLPNGLAINCTKHFPGCQADIEVFRSNAEFHLQHLLKSDKEKDLADNSPLLDKYPEAWAVLADKSYQGLAKDFRVITPFKKQPLRTLTLDQVQTNDRIAHDRAIVENVFGRLCTLWALCSDKYRWDESNYDMLFRACVALTNFHIRILPLRSEDGVQYENYLKRLHVIGHDARAKRLAVQKRYREKRKMRLHRMLAAQIGRPGGGLQDDSSDEESEDILSQFSQAFD